MAAYATTDDLAARWRPLVGDEESRADALLEDAAVWLRAWFPELDSQIADGRTDPAVALMVSCAMVKRAMLTTDYDGLSTLSSTQTAGVFTESSNRAFANPQGNLYITSAERDLLLGLSARTAVSRMSPGL